MFQALKAGKSRYSYDFPVAIICQYVIILSYKSSDEGPILYRRLSSEKFGERRNLYEFIRK